MKKLFLIALITSSTMSGLVQAADGTVKFTGNITNDTCQVDTDSKNQTVNLGTISRASFASVGDISTAQQFDIKLTDCPEGNIGVVFSGVADDVNNDLLKLDATMTASGVGVRISEIFTGNQIKLNNTTDATRVTIDEDGDATLSYVGQYQSTSATVVAGTADATTQFTILYN